MCYDTDLDLASLVVMTCSTLDEANDFWEILSPELPPDEDLAAPEAVDGRAAGSIR